MKRTIAACVIACALGMSYLYGVYSHRDRLPPYPQLLALRNRLFPGSIGFKNTRGKIELPCREIGSGKLMVALAFGQSNSGNHGETVRASMDGVYNFFRGRCYRAADPLLGPTGDRGSIWTRLGDLLVGSGRYDRVVFIPIGVGSTTIEDWTRGGYLHSRILTAIRESRARGLAITHLLWVQGGSEKRTRGDESNIERYRKAFHAMMESIRDEGVSAPVYVAVSTFNGRDVNPDIQAAQRDLADPGKSIYPGPDDDEVLQDVNSRWEEVHLSARSLDRCALEWVKALDRVEGDARKR
ncbi:MAG: hypothetical protein JW838_15475 [Spirochaetes bacterium]|nr:hypothetical protein [Spirochaetota bacterium]